MPTRPRLGALAGALSLVLLAAPAAHAKPHAAVAPAPQSRASATGPRLSASGVAGLPAGAHAGGTYAVRAAVANTGTARTAGPLTLRLMRRGQAPRTIATARVSVAAGSARTATLRATVPAGLRRGSWAVVACTRLGGTTGALACATAHDPLAVDAATPTRGARVRAALAAPAAAAPDPTCTSGARTLSKPGQHVYPEMGNGGYVSVHSDVNFVYEATTNTFLPGTSVTHTDRATQCLSDFSLDFERSSADTADGPDMAVSAVTVNGQPATFAFAQPTYPGDPNGQDDPDPLAHQAGQDTPVSATNPNPPACAPSSDDPADTGVACPANKLVVTPTTPIASGATFTVQVAYTGRPGVHHDGDGTTEGWFRSNDPAGDGSFVTTEPVGTEDWLPLNDHPSAKPTYDFTEQVTAGRTAIANGELTGFTVNAADATFPAGSTTWRWHSPEPIANYLVESSIGAFDLSERTAADGTLYYEAQGSTITPTQKAANKAVMDQQEDITQFQTRFNGPYPFTTAGVVVGIPSASFEEEMQTKITFNGGRISLGTFNHENMHQWWGDNVSESSFNETFFKEGFAQLGQYLQTARTAATTAGGLDTTAGQAAFDASLVTQFNTNYANNGSTWTAAPSDPTPETLFSSAVTYRRPATAYIALRQILGKDRFTAAMQQIQRDFGGGSITEAQLEAAFAAYLPNRSRACQDRLGQFFTQWFDTAYPAGGGANKPQLTGPGLAASSSATTFYDADGSCKQSVPQTRATLDPDAVDGRFHDPTITLTTTEADGTAAASRTYTVDGGAPTTYTGPFTVTGDGEHTVTFTATDADGAVEPAHTLTFSNASPPVTSAQVLPAPAGGQVVAPASVVLTATDDAAGVASTDVALDGAALAPYGGPLTVTEPGEHTVTYRSTDRLGAVEATRSLTFTVVAPTPPTDTTPTDPTETTPTTTTGTTPTGATTTVTTTTPAPAPTVPAGAPAPAPTTPAAPTAGPVPAAATPVRVRSSSLRAMASRRVTLSLSGPIGPGGRFRGEVTLTSGSSILARGTFALAPDRAGTVRVTLTQRAARLLRSRGRLRVNVTVVATAADGTVRRTVTRLTLRPPARS